MYREHANRSGSKWKMRKERQMKERKNINLYFNTKTVVTTLVCFVYITLPPPLYIAEVRKD